MGAKHFAFRICIVLNIAFSAGLVGAQLLTREEASMLLPAEVLVAGTVVDEAGKPIPTATIEHSVAYDPITFGGIWVGALHASGSTDQAGHFSIRTRAPILVIRKPGYQSERVNVGRASMDRIILHFGGTLPPLCQQPKVCNSLPLGKLCVVTPGEVIGGEPFQDADFRKQTFFLASPTHEQMIHGLGPNWSAGPTNAQVWGSGQYQETVIDYDGLEFIDARGVIGEGRHWRTVGTPKESFFYNDLDSVEAAIFDGMLDRMCILRTN